jgi:hypothetical protein
VTSSGQDLTQGEFSECALFDVSEAVAARVIDLPNLAAHLGLSRSTAYKCTVHPALCSATTNLCI